MQAVIKNLKSSPRHRLALMAVLADYYYFVGTSRGLNDSEKSQARWIVKEIEDSNLPPKFGMVSPP